MAEKNLGKGVSKFVAEIKKGLTGKLKDEISKVAAMTTASIIQRRTRQGRGVATDGGSLSRLKPLSRSYIEFRKRSKLSAFTTAGKSNLTFTGEMLGSLGAKRLRPGTWQVFLNGTRENGLTNAQLAKYVSRTRPFMFLAGGEIAQVQAAARRTFESLVKTEIKR